MSVLTFIKQDATEVYLSRKPFDISTQDVDDSVRTSAEDGYVATRPRDTKAGREVIRFTLANFTHDDEDEIRTLERSVKTSEWFYWVHYRTGTNLAVRFFGRPRYTRNVLHTTIEMVLEEV